MTAQRLLSLSARIEQLALVVTVLAVVLLLLDRFWPLRRVLATVGRPFRSLVRATRRAVVAAGAALPRMVPRARERVTRSTTWNARLTRPREAAWLAAIVAFAAAVRVIGWSRGLTAPFWFSEIHVLYADDILQQGTWWPYLRGLLTTYISDMHKSAAVMPIALLFQAVLGPSIHLPVLIGAFFGTAAVVLAWWSGRTGESRTFGLVFAALLAISPLQIVWSRLGGLSPACVPHVLLVLGLALAAGRRASVPLALLAGLASWVTLYHYYAARVAIPLGLAAFVSGHVAGGRPLRRALVPLAVMVGTFVAIYLVAQPPGLVATLWPSWPGYPTDLGGHGLWQFVGTVVDSIKEHGRLALRAYFWENRASARVGAFADPMRAGPNALSCGMECGGLVLAPIAVLGLLGLGRCLARPRQRFLWPLVAAAGLAVPVLSYSSARRFLVFDIAWCALAAHGVLAIADSRLLSGVSSRAAVSVLAIVLAAIGTWSFATIVLLNRVLPPQFGAVIPFGDSGMGDGKTCVGCVRAGHRWQEEIARNRFVVLFDSDVYREIRNIPGGLPVYGKLAALAAGRKENFVPFYSMMADADPEPPAEGTTFYPRGTDFSAYLAHRIARARPSGILWDFEQPTLWERWFASRLEEAGGIRWPIDAPPLRIRGVKYTSPGAPGDAFVIETSPDEFRDTFAVLRDLARATRPQRACVSLDSLSMQPAPTQPLVLTGTVPADGSGPPPWLLAGFADVRLGDRIFPFFNVVAAGYRPPPTEGIALISDLGSAVSIDMTRGSREPANFVLDTPIGFHCATYLANRWWVVDPISGEATSLPREPPVLPRGRWMGVERWSDHEIVLASADQEMHVVDVTTGAETLRFPATIWPSLRFNFGECAMLARGDGWIGSANPLVGSLSLYSSSGASLGTVQLVPRQSYDMLSLAAAGEWIATGTWGQIRTARLHVTPGCDTDEAGGPNDGEPAVRTPTGAAATD